MKQSPLSNITESLCPVHRTLRGFEIIRIIDPLGERDTHKRHPLSNVRKCNDIGEFLTGAVYDSDDTYN